MILLVALVVGVLTGYALGGRLRNLGQVRLRGESALVALVFATALAPRALEYASSRWHDMLMVAWALGMTMLIWLAWRNARTPGMAVLGVGLVANLVVILLNGGMPVDAEVARQFGGEEAVSRLAGSAFHVAAGRGTKLPFLGDIVPLPWGDALVSVGDLLMLAGVALFVAWGMRRGGSSPSAMGP